MIEKDGRAIGYARITMREKDTLALLIEDFGMEGEGVAHEGGTTLFVPYALPGERVKVAVVYSIISL